MPRWPQQRFSSSVFKAPRFEGCWCDALLGLVLVVLCCLVSWLWPRTPLQKVLHEHRLHCSPRCLNVHGKGYQYASFVLWEQASIIPPRFILTSTNAEIATFHLILHWRRPKGEKNPVSPSYDKDFRHFWQEPEGKDQNTLLLLKNSLPFQY